MITMLFLVEWALRSSILVLSGALLLWALRVKDASVRLAGWTAMLCGSLANPLISVALPKVPVAVMRVQTLPTGSSVVASLDVPAPRVAGGCGGATIRLDTRGAYDLCAGGGRDGAALAYRALV